MARRHCIDVDPRTRRFGICWCDGDRLVCVEIPDEIAEKSLGEIGRMPPCTKDFCRERGGKKVASYEG